MSERVTIIGGGLAGCEAAWQLARRGVAVDLHEMRPVRGTEAHRTDRLAELVCSNSFRSDDAMNNAVGLLHEEMRRCGSLILAAADAHKLPGGGTADYINCPLEREDYEAFVAALLAGEKTEFKEWETSTPYLEGCLPIEVMAARGPETLRFGPMKPVGLTDPRTGRRPFAVVQLRQDNALGTLYNIVGFQTKLKHGEQVRIFRRIPGLAGAEFARLGGLHRNTFLNSPLLLDRQLRLKVEPRLRFAGQVTGVEGYVESAAIGLLAGRFAAAARRDSDIAP